MGIPIAARYQRSSLIADRIAKIRATSWTAISMISFGITINRFSLYLIQAKLLQEQRAPLHDVANTGIGMVIAGLLMVGYAAIRYKQASASIARGGYSPHHLAIYISSGIVIVPGVTGLYWLFRRRSF